MTAHLIVVRRLLIAGLLLVVGVPLISSAPVAPRSTEVVERRIIGRSVEGRPIRAFRIGEPGKRVVVLISTMHGDERDARKILRALKRGPKISGIDLWVVPTYNPDGYAAGTRHNARGVDLNRNFPYRWAPLDGRYESGRRPKSEPETRAMIRFLRDVRPRRILSFHQPLYGVGADPDARRLVRRTARALKLPIDSFSCRGVCHGTMTGWFNHRFSGHALTVEYGVAPSRSRLRRQAPAAIVRLFHGSR
jgi:murein peptide amidase A